MEAMSKHYLSKKSMIKILVSLVSVFSFVLVSYSSTVFLLPLLSTLSMQQLFSYSSERNYIFLLCNGILVFIIKNSGFIANSSVLTDHDINYYNHQVIEKKTTEIHVHVTLDQSSDQIVKPAILFIQEEEEEEEGETDTIQNGILVTTGYPNNANSNSHDHGNEVEQPLMQLIDIPEYDNENYEHECEEDEEEGTEELNKRCEEFIRRMKENIKTEAKATQLIMIN